MRLSMLIIAAMLAASSVASADDAISWTAPTHCVDGSPITSCPVTGYIVSVANAPDTSFSTVVTVSGNTLSLNIPNTPDGTRCYKVVATSAGGNSDPSNTACKTQAPLSVPTGNEIVITVN